MIATIETEIIHRLTAITTDNYGWQFNAVHSYVGSFGDDEYKKLTTKLPVAFVGFAGESQPPQDEAGDAIRVFPKFNIAVIHGNLRNGKTMRNGVEIANGKDEVGIYQMMLDLRATLADVPWDLDATHLQPGALSTVAGGKAGHGNAAIMMSIDFTTNYLQKFIRDDGETLTGLDSNWQQMGETLAEERNIENAEISD